MTNQNQPSEVKEGGALAPCPFHPVEPSKIPPGLGGSLVGTANELETAEDVWSWTVRCWCGAEGPEQPTEAEAIAAWNRRPASMERGEAGADYIEGLDDDDFISPLAPSPAPFAWNAVAEAFRKGAMAALGCEPWDDADDFFSLVGMDYAQGKPFPPTMPKRRIGKSADADEIKAAYMRGWNDREDDIIERAERILPAPSAVEMAGVDRVALARAMFDAANDDLGNILVLGCGEHNYSDPEDAAWATALLMADSAILALATASREKGAES